MLINVKYYLLYYSGFTYSLNNNTNTIMMNNAITQTMKNRATTFCPCSGDSSDN